MSNSANQRQANRLEKLKQFMIEHQFDEELSFDDPFFFNIRFNGEEEIEIGDGSENEQLNVIMTSKRLMSFISKKGVGHSDGTYKITAHGYVLVIYGITDIRGLFHPIVLMISSHEQEKDFHYFYTRLKNLADTLGEQFEPKFMMMGACKASYNAVRKIFPKAAVLMCYYHVRANIKKQKLNY